MANAITKFGFAAVNLLKSRTWVDSLFKPNIYPLSPYAPFPTYNCPLVYALTVIDTNLYPASMYFCKFTFTKSLPVVALPEGVTIIVALNEFSDIYSNLKL